MPFQRPTLSEIDQRIKADITVKMGSQASVLKRAWTSIFARALAGAVHLLYGYIAWAIKQFFGDTAEREALLQKGAIYGLSLKPAEYAQGYVRVSGVKGSYIPVGTVFKRADGVRYEVDAPVTLAGTYIDVHVKAFESGIDGNLSAAAPVSLESPVTGLNPTASVSTTPGPIEGGFDEEDIEAFRQRYLDRIQNPPQGGSKADYKSWAEEIPGVGKAYVYSPGQIFGAAGSPPVIPASPPIDVNNQFTPPFGQVWVYITSTDPDNPTPSGQTLIDVQLALEEKKSATATVVVLPIIPHPISFSMNVHLSSNAYSETDARDQITAELKDLFIREGLPFQTLRLSQLNEAISNSAAEGYHELITPSADIALAYNEIAVVTTPITLTLI